MSLLYIDEDELSSGLHLYDSAKYEKFIPDREAILNLEKKSEFSFLPFVDKLLWCCQTLYWKSKRTEAVECNCSRKVIEVEIHYFHRRHYSKYYIRQADLTALLLTEVAAFCGITFWG